MISVVYILLCSLLNLVRSLPTSDFLSNSSGISSSSASSNIGSLQSSATLLPTTTTTTTTTIYFTKSGASSTLPDPPTTAESSISTRTSTTASTWSISPQFTNIAEVFNVTKFADDQRNSRIVSWIPADASASEYSPSSTAFLYVPIVATSTLGLSPSSGPGLIQIPIENHSDSDSRISSSDRDQSSSQSILQIFYPQGSINPSNTPRGGSQFYASPIDISSAQNVTFSYSVFFPANFDFVKGGKLPGLYGGHPGCSGGNDAMRCFSTRLMWRDGGEGELYLYAPKDKQTSDLCSQRHTHCESTYGISVGRGTFLFSRGKWTHVSQTAILNTPGQQDGSFTLDVNGERVIDRRDIFYRDSIHSSESSSGRTTGKPQSHKNDPSHPESPTPNPPLDGPALSPPHHKSGGLLGLVGLLGRKALDDGEDVDPTPDEMFILEPGDTQTFAVEVQDTVNAGMSEAEVGKVFSASSQLSRSQSFSALDHEDFGVHGLDSESISPSAHLVEFVGMFFSTFFGGHRRDWASPCDQYLWFKDFSMANNG